MTIYKVIVNVYGGFDPNDPKETNYFTYNMGLYSNMNKALEVKRKFEMKSEEEQKKEIATMYWGEDIPEHNVDGLSGVRIIELNVID